MEQREVRQPTFIQVNNFVLKTLIKEADVKYCEGINGNLFLLKYFKFDCHICVRFSTAVLVTHCCLTPVCFKCALELNEHFAAKNENVLQCLFCKSKVTN
mmetsp:Transcript_36980/g.27341  ORF Transcript_36980/g.27341 Transcript_36980/m.27341 type:complete len:100 (+) Transcript_36980:308-607(+)